jgi:hypothetical protein
VGLAVIAFARLWVTGDQGWNRALIGLFLGLVCLVPPAFLVWQELRHPNMQDLSTDLRDPPTLLSAPGAMTPDAARLEAAIAAFPNLRTRTYALDAARVFNLVTLLAAEQGWEVRLRREPPGRVGTGQLNALAMRPLGWRDEVAIRVAGRADGASVDMRSRSADGAFDIGGNGERIEQFLVALDGRVTRLMRDLPSSLAPEDTEAAPTVGTGG